MSKFAVFDIDGTIFRWQLYHELFDELHRQQYINDVDAKPVFEAREAWRDRKASFSDYELTLIKVMDKHSIGLSEKIFMEAADTIIEARGQHIYQYTKQLLKSLKDSGYIILAISGSQHPVVERFAKLHSIDIAHGSQVQLKDGVIVDNGPPVYNNKAKILTDLVEEHGLDWAESYAVGDTISDADMMELVTYPVAFNPDRNLYECARKKGWKIVVERKNIVYEMSSNGNTFVLA